MPRIEDDPSKVERPSVTDYNPVADRVATINRLGGIISGERRATDREIFEAAADVFASTVGEGNWQTADEVYLLTEEHGAFVGYYRGDNIDEDNRETSFVQALNRESQGPSFEFRRRTNGEIHVHKFEGYDDSDDGVRVNLNDGERIMLAQRLLEGIQAPEQAVIA